MARYNREDVKGYLTELCHMMGKEYRKNHNQQPLPACVMSDGKTQNMYLAADREMFDYFIKDIRLRQEGKGSQAG